MFDLLPCLLCVLPITLYVLSFPTFVDLRAQLIPLISVSVTTRRNLIDGLGERMNCGDEGNWIFDVTEKTAKAYQANFSSRRSWAKAAHHHVGSKRPHGARSDYRIAHHSR